MTSTTTCPSCQRPLRVPDSLLGQNVKCPACGTTFASALEQPHPTPAQRREEPPTADAPLPHQTMAARREEEERRPARCEEDRPRRRARDEEDEDDYDERPRRRRQRHDRGTDDRSTVILVLGICAWVVFPLPFGPIAWFMGNNALREIRAGRMNREGQSNVNIGRILGMISTILFLLVVLGCGAIVMIGILASLK
jgi:predicted Zn finger-like uncharacterized protein